LDPRSSSRRKGFEGVAGEIRKADSRTIGHAGEINEDLNEKEDECGVRSGKRLVSGVPALVSNREKRDLFGRIRSSFLGCPAPSREVAFSYFLTPLGKA
jgi:hypothetical protein